MLTLLLACTDPEPKTTDSAIAHDSEADTDTDTYTDTDTDTDTDSDTDSDTDTDTDADTDTNPPAEDGWPTHFFAPYVDATGYPTVKIGEIPAENQTYYYTLAFIVAQGAGDCTATWGTYYSIETGPSAWENGQEYTLYEQLDTLRAAGGDVMVSFGGAANVPIEAACSSVSEVVSQYERVISALSLTRIDFDIEGSWVADSVSITRRSEAIASLQASHSGPLHVWYTLPVLPSGLTSEGVAVVQSAVDHGVVLDGINVMTMDYGDGTAPNPDGQMGQYGIDAITALHSQLTTIYGNSKTDAELWAMVGSTPMIGQNDVQSEVFYIADAEQTLNFAQQNGVGMLGMWSINRDHPCAEQVEWAQPGCNGLVDVGDWGYSLAFSSYNLP